MKFSISYYILRQRLVKNIIKQIDKKMNANKTECTFFIAKEMWGDKNYIVNRICSTFPTVEVIATWASYIGKIVVKLHN